MTPEQEPDCAGASGYHATVRKRDGLWMYRVFGYWRTARQEVIMQGTSRDWLTAFAQAAGTVSSFRMAYEYTDLG